MSGGASGVCFIGSGEATLKHCKHVVTIFFSTRILIFLNIVVFIENPDKIFVGNFPEAFRTCSFSTCNALIKILTESYFQDLHLYIYNAN